MLALKLIFIVTRYGSYLHADGSVYMVYDGSFSAIYDESVQQELNYMITV
jgi:hypothetical protein